MFHHDFHLQHMNHEEVMMSGCDKTLSQRRLIVIENSSKWLIVNNWKNKGKSTGNRSEFEINEFELA